MSKETDDDAITGAPDESGASIKPHVDCKNSYKFGKIDSNLTTANARIARIKKDIAQMQRDVAEHVGISKLTAQNHLHLSSTLVELSTTVEELGELWDSIDDTLKHEAEERKRNADALKAVSDTLVTHNEKLLAFEKLKTYVIGGFWAVTVIGGLVAWILSNYGQTLDIIDHKKPAAEPPAPVAAYEPAAKTPTSRGNKANKPVTPPTAP